MGYTCAKCYPVWVAFRAKKRIPQAMRGEFIINYFLSPSLAIKAR